MSIFATNLETTIRNGGVPLADLLSRIDAAWAGFRVTDEERAELCDLARSKARPEDSMSPLYDRVAELERKVAALEAQAAPEDPEDPGEPGEPADEWPAYRQPTCAADAYHVGDRVTWQGKRYVCAYEGAVWTPAEYPAAWAEWVEPGADGPGPDEADADAETEEA